MKCMYGGRCCASLPAAADDCCCCCCGLDTDCDLDRAGVGLDVDEAAVTEAVMDGLRERDGVVWWLEWVGEAEAAAMVMDERREAGMDWRAVGNDGRRDAAADGATLSGMVRQ